MALRPAFRACAVAVLGFSIVASPAWGGDQRRIEQAARSAGTLSSATRALIDRATDEPVELGIRATRRWLSGGRAEPAEEHIVFRLPAAAVSLIDFDDLDQTNQRIGWTFCSGTLDPVRLDAEADRAACAPTNRDCPAQGRVAARRHAGEYALRVELTGVLRTVADRHRILWGLSGMRESVWTRVHGPCAYRLDPALDLLATEEPMEASAARACRLSGFVGQVTGDGRRYRPANFLKLEPDGSARLVVRCMAYMHDVPHPMASNCELQGYLGIWPLFLWVPSNRAADWDETFLRVREHLARHVVSRSDPP